MKETIPLEETEITSINKDNKATLKIFVGDISEDEENVEQAHF